MGVPNWLESQNRPLNRLANRTTRRSLPLKLDLDSQVHLLELHPVQLFAPDVEGTEHLLLADHSSTNDRSDLDYWRATYQCATTSFHRVRVHGQGLLRR